MKITINHLTVTDNYYYLSIHFKRQLNVKNKT